MVVRNSVYFCFYENDDFIKKIISAKMVIDVNGRCFKAKGGRGGGGGGILT